MKTIKTFTLPFTIAILTLIASGSAYAQIGIKAGITVSNFYYTDRNMDPYLDFDIDLRPYLGYDVEWVQLGDQKPVNSPYFGAYYNYKFSKKFSFRPELFFTQKGVNLNQFDYERVIYRVKISYLELPLSIGYQFISKEKFTTEFYLGGYGAYALNAYKKTAAHDAEVEKKQIKNVREFEAGMHLGFHLRFKVSEKFIPLDIRYFIGLTDLFEMPDDQAKIYHSAQKTKNTGFNLTVGYEF